jgi:hypothetical protein
MLLKKKKIEKCSLLYIRIIFRNHLYIRVEETNWFVRTSKKAGNPLSYISLTMMLD